jgi:SAM-dependent methyltransferase
VNVGAGTGSYEPPDLDVVAIEPSEQMIARRPAHASPAISAHAEAIPLGDSSVDVAMAVLSAHHFEDPKQGLAEMIRVARRRVVIFTWDPDALAAFWLTADYLPHLVDDARWRAAAAGTVADLLCGRITTVPIPHDCRDGFLGAYWRRPEAYLDPGVRAGMSSLAGELLPATTAGLRRLDEDVASGAWARRQAHLLGLQEMDLGYRLIVADL